MNGPGTVTYRWERSDGQVKPSQSLVFAAAGSRTVTDQWSSVPISTTNGWQLVRVGSPNEVLSNQATFQNSCK
jgi:hypothetical protein